MKTLWISILGFSSGNTGLVINNGENPYNGDNPVGEATVAKRFQKEGCVTILAAANSVNSIKLLSYDRSTHTNITIEQLIEALDPLVVCSEGDGLAGLLDDDDDDE